MTAKKTEKELDVLNEVNRVPMTEESRSRMSLNIYDLQYLIRLQDMSNDAFRVELHELYEQDNDAMCKNIAEIVAAQNKLLFDTLKIQSEGIKHIISDITEVKIDIASINSRLGAIEKRLDNDEDMIKAFEERLRVKKERIDNLEREIRVLRPDIIAKLLEEINLLEPTIKRLVKTQSWWNIALRILLAVVISTMITLIIHYNVPHKFELKPDQRVEIITK